MFHRKSKLCVACIFWCRQEQWSIMRSLSLTKEFQYSVSHSFCHTATWVYMQCISPVSMSSKHLNYIYNKIWHFEKRHFPLIVKVVICYLHWPNITNWRSTQSYRHINYAYLPEFHSQVSLHASIPGHMGFTIPPLRQSDILI